MEFYGVWQQLLVRIDLASYHHCSQFQVCWTLIWWLQVVDFHIEAPPIPRNSILQMNRQQNLIWLITLYHKCLLSYTVQINCRDSGYVCSIIMMKAAQLQITMYTTVVSVSTTAVISLPNSTVNHPLYCHTLACDHRCDEQMTTILQLLNYYGHMYMHIHTTHLYIHTSTTSDWNLMQQHPP